MKEKEELKHEEPPKIISYCLDKAQELIHSKRFIKSFCYGIVAIILGIVIATFYHFRKYIILGFVSILLFYILAYWVEL